MLAVNAEKLRRCSSWRREEEESVSAEVTGVGEASKAEVGEVEIQMRLASLAERGVDEDGPRVSTSRRQDRQRQQRRRRRRGVHSGRLAGFQSD